MSAHASCSGRTCRRQNSGTAQIARKVYRVYERNMMTMCCLRRKRLCRTCTLHAVRPTQLSRAVFQSTAPAPQPKTLLGLRHLAQARTEGAAADNDQVPLAPCHSQKHFLKKQDESAPLCTAGPICVTSACFRSSCGTASTGEAAVQAGRTCRKL